MGGQGSPLLVSRSPRVLDQQGIPLPAGFQAVNLTAQACLSPINATSVQKDWAAHLAVRLVAFRFFQDRDRDERADSPGPAEHTGFLVEGGDRGGWDLQHEI